jgi:hypothetical protein
MNGQVQAPTTTTTPRDGQVGVRDGQVDADAGTCNGVGIDGRALTTRRHRLCSSPPAPGNGSTGRRCQLPSGVCPSDRP